MTYEEKMKIFKETFNIDDSIDIDINMPLASLDEWDSMAKLSLIIIFNDYCNKKLTFDMLDKYITIKDVFEDMDK